MGDLFAQSLQTLFMAVAQTLPAIILAILLFIVGWLIANLVREGLREIIRAIKLDRALAHTGLDAALRRAGFTLDSGLFLGEIVKWFIVILFLQLSLGLVGLNQVNTVLTSVAGYLPNVIVAGITILAGALIAKFVGRVVEGSARAAEIGSGHSAGTIARWAIWIFVGFAAVSQLQVLNQIIQPLLWGIIAMLALAGGLAFGLGGRDWAAKKLHDWSNN